MTATLHACKTDSKRNSAALKYLTYFSVNMINCGGENTSPYLFQS